MGLALSRRTSRTSAGTAKAFRIWNGQTPISFPILPLSKMYPSRGKVQTEGRPTRSRRMQCFRTCYHHIANFLTIRKSGNCDPLQLDAVRSRASRFPL